MGVAFNMAAVLSAEHEAAAKEFISIVMEVVLP